MAGPEGIAARIRGILHYVSEAGVSRDQQQTVCRWRRPYTTVSFPGAEHISAALKNHDYRQIYRHLVECRAYTAVMLDHAVVQIMYRFRGSELIGHRLAFFAAPDLGEFQNAPEWYRRDDRFADVIGTATAPALIRFDYDADERRHRSVVHPKSHLTLGRYEGCRIPVSAPLSPYRFMDFVLRNFYDTPAKSYSSALPRSRSSFGDTIDASERLVMHMAVPG